MRVALAFGIALVVGLGLSAQSTVGNFSRLVLGGLPGAGTVDVRTGTGTPESAVTGTIGDVFLRTDGSTGTTMYVKESGAATTTGWIGMASSSASGGVTATSTTVFTGKTLDAEGSGNIVTTVEKWRFHAAICQNVTAVTDWSTPTTNPAVAACATGTNTQIGTLDFADGAPTLSAQRTMRLPADWSGTVDAQLDRLSSTTSGNVVWQVATICAADTETIDPAFNTASTVTDATQGVASRLNTAAITGVTTTGCAAGEQLFLRVFRDPANGSDTMAGTARLVSVELTIRRAQ